jgi:hypothetical protein
MKNEFIPYEQALALKELGFDEPCFAAYIKAGRFLDISEYVNHGDYRILAPLYQQAFRWFREKYVFYINMVSPDLFYFVIHYINPIKEPTDLFISECCETHEEAELACLKKIIELSTEKPEGDQI